jgi:hypothetical protein
LSDTFDITCENPPDDCATAEYDPALNQPGDTLNACLLPDLERSNPLWSHSNHCSNWDFVRFFVQRFIGIRSPIVVTVACMILPVGAGRFSPLFLRFSIETCRNCPFFRAFY